MFVEKLLSKDIENLLLAENEAVTVNDIQPIEISSSEISPCDNYRIVVFYHVVRDAKNPKQLNKFRYVYFISDFEVRLVEDGKDCPFYNAKLLATETAKLRDYFSKKYKNYNKELEAYLNPMSV